MSYPPTNPGYPQTQQTGPYGAPGPSFAPTEAGPSKLPLYLTIAVVVLGLAAYLASFGPVFTVSAELGPFGGAELTGSGGGYPIIAAALAALLAAVSLLPKVKGYSAVVAAVSALAVLLVIAQLVSKPTGFSVGWALWLVLAFTVLEALAAVAVLLFESGVIAPPAPRPRYDQFGGHYGPPPGGYYGQGPAQRPNYPSQQQYGGYSSGPSTGGFGSAGPQNGPPTPPTGFPSFSPPPSVGSGQQQPEQGQPGQHSQAPSSSPPSGPTPS